MPKRTLLAIAVVLLASVAVIGPVAGIQPGFGDTMSTPNEAPLADVGLDQKVQRGATVLLDGTGSQDPDGEIERYQWSIRTPSNATIAPDCADCARTAFAPSEVGEYRVTLTVTDDDGATRSDALYVEVSPGTEPTISLSGPEQPTEGTAATYAANLDAGTAALDYVVWTVDGVEIANHSLSAVQASDEATKRFPTAGTRTVTATVYDADGQSATSSLTVSVQQESDDGGADDGSSGSGPAGSEPSDSNSPDSESAIADHHDPTVVGDALVTGTEPLRGQYDVRSDASSELVDSVEWRNVAGRVGTGRSLVRTWQPGDHQLYAVVTYQDGSENVATFSDGTTTVTADPKPNVSVDSFDRWGAIAGSPSAVDEYGNLASLRVEIDGQTVATSPSTRRGRELLDTDREKGLYFSHDDFEPGERYSVTVVATDERGQTTEVSRDVVPVKKPEIVRSEFVNGPVDSYHERIDPSRYAAHHVLKIDLNGVDPEKVDIEVKGEGSTVAIEDGTYGQKIEYIPQRDVARIDSFWAGNEPGEYNIESRYELSRGDLNWKDNEKDNFEVTPSKPELRLDVLNDGTEDYITKNHGILVDASNSFDPDGTDLKYIWKKGAEPTKPDNTTAKFNAYERAQIVLADQYDLKTRRNATFLDYFVPNVEEPTVVTNGPYFPNETVRVQFVTSAFSLSKSTYYDQFDLGVRISEPEAELKKWTMVEATNSNHSDATEDAYRYVGVVEIPASELAPEMGNPTITVYNENNEQKTDQVDVPDVNVLLEDKAYWTNTTVRDLAYTVEKPVFDEVTTTSSDMRDAYLERGYSIETTEREIEFVLQEQVKVQDAEYDQRTRNFTSETVRGMFLESRRDWYPAGTTQEQVTRTRTTSSWHSADNPGSKSKWNDGNLRNGEYTGQSREVVVEPAEYEIQRQYRYDYEVEKTDTRTVVRTRTVQVPHTGTRTETYCIPGHGCHTKTITYTYYTTETYRYTVTETYTYTVTRTRTYWAPTKFSRDHQPTGETRRVKIEDAEYETQYEIERKEQYTDAVTRYVAAYDELVQPAQYEWQESYSTTDPMQARQTASNDDWRIGQSIAEAEWTLRKRTGTEQVVTSKYGNESNVVETSVTVDGDWVQKYYNIETGEKVIGAIESRSARKTYTGAMSRQEILSEVTSDGGTNDECKLKDAC